METERFFTFSLALADLTGREDGLPTGLRPWRHFHGQPFARARERNEAPGWLLPFPIAPVGLPACAPCED